jgi:hypothetical protein
MKKPRGRPTKPKGQRKDVDLRIPVTLAQKARIMEAAESAGGDMAAWARPILLQAAEDQLQNGGERGN